jgi:Ca2+/Na+ antiporter
VVALIAGVTQIQVVGEMTSIGTLFAFLVVCAAVIVLRVQRPEAVRSFRVPGGFVIPVLGILSSLGLMLFLPVITWVRFLVWLDIGIFIYWFYGRLHSPLADRAEQRRRPALEAAGNFVTMLGTLALFNGFFVTILGFMTTFGLTSETTAKWEEIGVTPERADIVGLSVLGIGLVLFAIGRIVAKSGAR